MGLVGNVMRKLGGDGVEVAEGEEEGAEGSAVKSDKAKS